MTASRFMVTPRVKRELQMMGRRIKLARTDRGITASLLAERARIGRPTLARIEDGDPGVRIGAYFAVLNSLGLLDGLGDVPDPQGDFVRLQRSARNAAVHGKTGGEDGRD